MFKRFFLSDKNMMVAIILNAIIIFLLYFPFFSNSPFLLISDSFFVLIVLVGGIFGLSLANAIFVDEMTLDNNLELEVKIDSLKEEIGELKEMLRTNP